MTNPKKCCVIPKNDAERREFYNNEECQFKDLTVDYELEGEHFCILHLPYFEKEKRELYYKALEVFDELLNQKVNNFDFISMRSMFLDSNHNHESHIFYVPFLSFQGSDIHYLCIKGLNNFHLAINFKQARFCAINVENSNFFSLFLENISFAHTELMRHISIENCTITQVSISNSKLRINNIAIHESKISNFILRKCILNGHLKFMNNTQVEQLDLRDTSFNESPSLGRLDLNSLQMLYLPTKIHFNALFKQAQNNAFWRKHYDNFRRIYIITQDKKMFVEQNDYFHLMQTCLEKRTDTPCMFKAFSWMYKKLFDYGQSIIKPILWIILLWIFSTFGYWKIYTNFNNAIWISSQQIVKPFSILYDKDQKNDLDNSVTKESQTEYIEYNVASLRIKTTIEQTNNHKASRKTFFWAYIISAIQSSLSLTSITLLLIALRWHFRKI